MYVALFHITSIAAAHMANLSQLIGYYLWLYEVEEWVGQAFCVKSSLTKYWGFNV